MHFLSTLSLAASLFALGCSSPNAPLSAPSYDPEAMTQAAIRQYDKNGNGKLDGAELDACPALKTSLAQLDTNKDGGLSADELTARFKSYQAAGVGAIGVSCTVELNGAPLEGATVTFTPEDCMLKAIKGGSGTSDASGRVDVVAEDGAPGLPCGLYKVTVSKKAGGGDALPAKYNTATTLGREVAANPRGGSPSISLKLTVP